MIQSAVRDALVCLSLMLVVPVGMHQSWAGEEALAPTANFDSPVPSPDGTRLLFSSDIVGRYTTVWIANRDGSNARPFVNWVGSNQTDPDWAPNGRSVVFSSDRDSVGHDVWRVSADGTGALRLTANSGDNRQPRFSPDGARIVFTSNRTGKDEIWYMSADGTNQKAVGLQSLLINDPAWSPDGTRIAFSGCLRPPNGSAITDGVCNIYIIALDASSASQVTFGKVNDWSPDWGPLGIVFSSSRSGGQTIWIVDPQGTSLRQVTDGNDGLNLDPRWDYTTNTIVFSKVGETPNVWATDLFGTRTQLTRLVGKNSGGVVVRDGSDVNSDGIVDCADLAVIRQRFGAISGKTGYDLRADLNGDAAINVRDLAFVAQKLPKGTVCK